MQHEPVNILLVDDQPAKLLSYEIILRGLGENLIKASSAQEALQYLLKNDVAVVLVDVCMPEFDGFELAAMIREHPRFQRTAIIFISAILHGETDHLRGYEMGAVDYVPVPVVPQVLRAKVRVFAELYRTTRQLERLNKELEQRVTERTAELEASNARLLESEQRRSVALMAGQMGSWDWDLASGKCNWDEGQFHVFGLERQTFLPVFENIRPFIHSEDVARIEQLIAEAEDKAKPTFQMEVRIFRPNGEMRWCLCAAALTRDEIGKIRRVSGVTIDITDRKQAEERQLLLAREVDHRARNTLAVVQAIVRLTHAASPQAQTAAIEGRIRALAQAHTLLSQSRWIGADVTRLVDEELSPYRNDETVSLHVAGPEAVLAPDRAQSLALALHELATNSAKYGALSSRSGELKIVWHLTSTDLVLHWSESGGPSVTPPTTRGFGTRIIHTIIKHQIGGDVSFDWQPSGLRCMLSIPYANGSVTGHASMQEDHQSQMTIGSRKRVLLVEDEALIGMMMRDLLEDLGLSVIGPVHSVADGLRAIAAQDFDCAILDLNLGGEPVYPLALAIAQKSIPLIFATGYALESVDAAYSAIPVLQKPIAREELEEALRRELGSLVSVPIPGSVLTEDSRALGLKAAS